MVKKISLIAFVLMLFAALGVNAQVTTSALSGKVTLSDNDEDVIGATVVAVHNPSGTRYTGVTNQSGRYTIQGMRVGGPYTVTVSYIGYETKQIDGVTLTLGETEDLDVNLAVSSQQLEEVVVTGRGGIDASKTGAAMAFSSADIAMVPSIDHSIADATRLNPMVNISQSGAMSFNGVSNRYNNFMVDGAASNDVFGLTSNGQNGGQAGTQPISMETVDQIQVQVAPFDVRQSGFTGGAINAITKSGTNQLHGSVFGDWRNEDLIGKKYRMRNGNNSEKYNDEKTYHVGATLGGPIVKDKLFFFANYEYANDEYSNNYKIGSAASRVDADVANQMLAALQAKGYTGTFNNPDNYTKSHKGGIKLDWNISDKHKLTLGWRHVNAKQLNGNSTATYLNSTDYQYDFKSVTNSFTAELHSNFSSAWSNEALLSYVRVRDLRNPYGVYPMISVAGVGNGSVSFGTERSSCANGLNQDIWSFTDNVNWYKGDHTVTFGVHGELLKFGNLFIQDAYGSYYFNSPDDFYAALNGEAGHIRQYRFGMANTDVTGAARWWANFKSGQAGAYIQDKWVVDWRQTWTFGLRVDVPFMLDTPEENAAFNTFAQQMSQANLAGLSQARQYAAYAQADYWNGLKTNQKFKSTPLISPRIGFRFNLDRARNYVLRGGAGMFTGRIPFVWLSNNFSNTGIQLSTYNVSGNAASALTLVTDPANQQANYSKLAASGSQVVNVFEHNFKFAQTLRLDLALDAHTAGIDWTAEVLYSKTLNDVVWRNLAYNWDGVTTVASARGISFDNRPYLTRATNGTPFNGVYALGNTSRGHTFTAMLRAEKKFRFGLDVAASYSYTESKSVNYGGSSVAASNYNYNYTHGDPNAPEVGNSAYNIPHKITVSVNYSKDYAQHWNTSVGLIYTANSGSPYSIYYYGDYNNDGSNGNDLIFIPTKDQLKQMTFIPTSRYTAEQQAAAMESWIERDDYLSKHRGQYYDRFADNEQFEHHFDFHFAQTYKFRVGKFTHAFTLTFNIQNVGNMLNKKWGRYMSSGVSKYYSPITYNARSNAFQFLHDENYDMRNYEDYYSRWRAQIGLKYTF